MKRLLKTLLVLPAIFSSQSYATDFGSLDTAKLSENIEFFYLNSDPKKITEIAKGLIKENMLDGYRIFFSLLARKYKQDLPKYLKMADYRFERHEPLIKALWLGGNSEDAITYAKKANWRAYELLSLKSNPTLPQDYSIDHLDYVSAMSSSFSVFGDTLYAEKLFQTLEKYPKYIMGPWAEEDYRELVSTVIGALVLKHESYYQICKKLAQVKNGATRKYLGKMLQNVKQNAVTNLFPDHTGFLTARILLTDSPAFSNQWNKTPMMLKYFHPETFMISYPFDHKEMRINLVFSGFELDSSLYNSVAYDMQITDPNGKIIYDSKDVQALSKRVSCRFFYQLAENTPKVDFKHHPLKPDNNVPGIYDVAVTLKDNLSHKKLELRSRFALLNNSNRYLRLLFPAPSKSKQMKIYGD